MCTVIFLPNNGKYCFASLRDESPLRQAADAPVIYTNHQVTFLAPIDAQAGGTWVGANEFGSIIILLNGGFENHTRQSNYIKSRGLIVKELLTSKAPVSDWLFMSLNNIEPFTLVVWQRQQLFELIWDGVQKHNQQLSTTMPHIWSSSTLYNTTAKQQRKVAFQHWWATQPPISKQSMLSFFQSVVDEENGFLMYRSPTMKTLSFTFLTQDATTTICYYHNFLNASCSTRQLPLNYITLAL